MTGTNREESSLVEIRRAEQRLVAEHVTRLARM